MPLLTEPYLEQLGFWPKSGRHILAQSDAETIVVYQAYRPSIGKFAIEHGQLGGKDFSFSRMSWIKPNFLWMMYRSGWGRKEGQEATLALRLRRPFFESLLAQAVESTWNNQQYSTREEWTSALATSPVRLQWDPDHDPHGQKLDRRAIQLGLSGEVLEAFARRELLEVIDLTDFVTKQCVALSTSGPDGIRTPRERVYSPTDSEISSQLGLSTI